MSASHTLSTDGYTQPDLSLVSTTDLGLNERLAGHLDGHLATFADYVREGLLAASTAVGLEAAGAKFFKQFSAKARLKGVEVDLAYGRVVELDEESQIIARLIREAESGRDEMVLDLFESLGPWIAREPLKASAAAGRALDAARRFGHPHRLVQVLHLYGMVRQGEGRNAEAVAVLSEARELAMELGDATAEARSRAVLGQIHRGQDEYESARRESSRAAELYASVGDQRGMAQALGDLGNAEDAAGRIETAERHYRRAIELFEEVEDMGSVVHVRTDLFLALFPTRPVRALGHLLQGCVILFAENRELDADGLLWEGAQAHASLERPQQTMKQLQRQLRRAGVSEFSNLCEALWLRSEASQLWGFDEEVWTTVLRRTSPSTLQRLFAHSADTWAQVNLPNAVEFRRMEEAMSRAEKYGAVAAAHERKVRSQLHLDSEMAELASVMEVDQESTEPSARLQQAFDDASLLSGTRGLAHLALAQILTEELPPSLGQSKTPEILWHLGRAVELLRGTPSLPWLAASRELSSVLRHRHDLGRRAQHEWAIQVLAETLRREVPLTAETISAQAACRVNLANCYLFRDQRTQPSDLRIARGLLEDLTGVGVLDPSAEGHAFMNLALAVASGADDQEAWLHAEQLYLAAIGRLSPADEPGSLAMAEFNLGSLYVRCPYGDRAVNVELAIQRLQRAESSLVDLGRSSDVPGVQDSLAQAYGERMFGVPRDNLNRAVALTAEALEAMSGESSGYDLAGMLNNFGNRLLDLADVQEDDERPGTLELARKAYAEALARRSVSNYPMENAQTCHNLGQLELQATASGDGEAATRAIGWYRRALQHRSPAVSLADWGQSRLGLALALGHRGSDGDRKDAVAVLSDLAEALLFGSTFLTAVEELAHLLIEDGELERAASRLDSGLSAIENALEHGGSPTWRLQQLDQAQRLALSLAEVRLLQGRNVDAVLTLERRRTEILLEGLLETADENGPSIRTLLHSEDLRPERLIKPSALHFRRWAALGELAATTIPQLTTEEFSDIVNRSGPIVCVLPARDGLWYISCTHVAEGLQTEAHHVPGPVVAELLPEILGEPPRPGMPGRVGLLTVNLNIDDAAQLDTTAVVSAVGQLIPPSLWQELEEDRPLTIIAAGWTNLLPWPAAVDPEAGRSLFEYRPVQVTPSVRALRLLQPPENLSTIVAFGDPQGDLPYAQDEAMVIADVFGGSAFTEEAATRGAARDALMTADIVHFACHGRFDPVDPLMSGLSLSDGPFTLHDIQALEKVSPLVVLSACSTGLSDGVLSPNEVIGLASAFLQRGAGGVVASLWPVDDRETAQLMVAFHRGVARGLRPAESLRRAQMTIAPNSASGSWASFVYIGA